MMSIDSMIALAAIPEKAGIDQSLNALSRALRAKPYDSGTFMAVEKLGFFVDISQFSGITPKGEFYTGVFFPMENYLDWITEADPSWRDEHIEEYGSWLGSRLRKSIERSAGSDMLMMFKRYVEDALPHEWTKIVKSDSAPMDAELEEKPEGVIKVRESLYGPNSRTYLLEVRAHQQAKQAALQDIRQATMSGYILRPSIVRDEEGKFYSLAPRSTTDDSANEIDIYYTILNKYIAMLDMEADQSENFWDKIRDEHDKLDLSIVKSSLKRDLRDVKECIGAIYDLGTSRIFNYDYEKAVHLLDAKHKFEVIQ